MSKPRKIKLTEGTVLLSGFSKEAANELEEYIEQYKKPVVEHTGTLDGVLTNTVSATITPDFPKSEAINLKDKAIGLVEKSPRQFKIVVIGYNCESKESVIEEIKDAGNDKQHAISMFKQELFKRGLV